MRPGSHPAYIYLSTHSFIHPFHPSIHPSIYPSIYSLIFPFTHLSFLLSMHLFIQQTGSAELCCLPAAPLIPRQPGVNSFLLLARDPHTEPYLNKPLVRSHTALAALRTLCASALPRKGHSTTPFPDSANTNTGHPITIEFQ
jgi:hypothetical protein